MSELRCIMLFNHICNDGTKNFQLTKQEGESETDFCFMDKIFYIKKLGLLKYSLYLLKLLKQRRKNNNGAIRKKETNQL